MVKALVRHRTAYLMITPLLLLILGFVIYPFCLSVIQSFKFIDLTRPDQVDWIGFKNYADMLQDADVMRSFLNTGYITVACVACELLFGLAIALVLKHAFKYRFIILAILILPWSLPPIVGGVTWNWIFNPQYGLLNVLLLRLGVIQEYHLWTLDKWMALLIICLIHVWRNMPFAAIILLAFVQQIPADLYESSSIDGANRRQAFRYITLPMLRPAITIAFSMSTIAAINIFDEIFIVNSFGLETRSIMVENYMVAFRELRFGYGMALSMVVTLIALLFNWSYIKGMYREEEYL